MKIYTISPSELSYVCDHCAYIGKNFNLYPKMISAGVTQTLDSMEKEYFLGDVKKIYKNMNKTSNTKIEVSLSDEKKYAIANVTIYD